MIRLTNPNEHEVHVTDPRTKITTCLSPAKALRVKSKVYEILIEEDELKGYDAFIRMKMIKGERVLPVKSDVDQTAQDTVKTDEAVLVLGSAPGKSAVAAAVAASHPTPASETVAPPAVPARKFNVPAPIEEAPVRITKPPVIPRRKV